MKNKGLGGLNTLDTPRCKTDPKNRSHVFDVSNRKMQIPSFAADFAQRSPENCSILTRKTQRFSTAIAMFLHFQLSGPVRDTPHIAQYLSRWCRSRRYLSSLFTLAYLQTGRCRLYQSLDMWGLSNVCLLQKLTKLGGFKKLYTLTHFWRG